MTCTDCGQDTLGPGVCIDCSNDRFDDYPRLKAIVANIDKQIEIYQERLDKARLEGNSLQIQMHIALIDILEKLKNPPTELECETVDRNCLT